jgi:RNA polymerase sigma factor (sigma-70 family)
LAADPSRGRASQLERHAEATTDLYERYSGQVFGYCFHRLGSREEAEDAVQTTFMNAFRGLARGIDPKVESAWVFKIAHNVCLARRRSSWRRRRVELPNDLEVLQEVVPAKEKIADELISLQPALEAMPEAQRRAILLREWQGLSYREIADELDLSQGAAETLIFRARRALASGLEEPPRRGVWRKRFLRGADVGGVLAFVKAMIGGGGVTAVKVGTVVALAGAAVATTAADRMLPLQRPPAKAPVGLVPRQAPERAKASSAQAGRLVDMPRLRHAPTQRASVKKATKPPRRPAVVLPPTSGAPAQPALAPETPVRQTAEPVPPETAPPPAQTNQGTPPAPKGNDPKTPLGTQARPSDSPPAPGTPDTPPQINEKQPLPDDGPVTQPPGAPEG